MLAQTHKRVFIGTVNGENGIFGDAPGDIFFQVELTKQAAENLGALLTRATDPVDRRWVSIIVTFHDPNRLRVTHTPAPAYEQAAAQAYLRGDAVRVTGKIARSVNLDLSSRLGVDAFRDLLARTSSEAQNFLLLRVPTRRHDLIELIADVQMHTAPADEGVGITGLALAEQVWAMEDFSDWEAGADGK